MSEPTINFHIQTKITQFKVPTELIKKNFKSIQKLIEKQKKATEDDIRKIKNSSKLSTQLKLALIHKNIKSFEQFSLKLQSLINKDQSYASRILARLENFKELEEFTVNRNKSYTEYGSDGTDKRDISNVGALDEDDQNLDLHHMNLINWYREQTNLLIIEYLIKSNSRRDSNIGIQLLKCMSKTNPKLTKLIDYDLLDSFNRIYVSIVKEHDISLVISWFNENRAFLKKVNSNLEFEINYCKFLSLVEKGEVTEAIKFSKENLSCYGNMENYQEQERENLEENLRKLKEIGGFLIYLAIGGKQTSMENSSVPFSTRMITHSPRYKEYEKVLSNERWDSLSKCFIDNFVNLYGISRNHPLFIYLSAGLSSLKTKSCYCNTENSIFKTDELNSISQSNEPLILTDKKYRGPNYYYKLLKKINHCPVCSPELYKLSRNLPYAQLITSIFNNPFKLPNGNIYPFDKLLVPSEKYLSEKNDLLRMGKVKDPLTKEEFLIDECVRVYPA